MGCSALQPGPCRAGGCAVGQQDGLVEGLRHLLFRRRRESDVWSPARAAFGSAWRLVRAHGVPGAALPSGSPWNATRDGSLDFISEGAIATYTAICLHTYPNNQTGNPLTGIHRKIQPIKQIIRSSGKDWTRVLLWIASLFTACFSMKKNEVVLFSKPPRFW